MLPMRDEVAAKVITILPENILNTSATNRMACDPTDNTTNTVPNCMVMTIILNMTSTRAGARTSVMSSTLTGLYSSHLDDYQAVG
jgi:hypothetical protein